MLFNVLDALLFDNARPTARSRVESRVHVIPIMSCDHFLGAAMPSPEPREYAVRDLGGKETVTATVFLHPSTGSAAVDRAPEFADVRALSAAVARTCHLAAASGLRSPRLSHLLDLAEDIRAFADTWLARRARDSSSSVAHEDGGVSAPPPPPLPRALARWWLRLCAAAAAAGADAAGAAAAAAAAAPALSGVSAGAGAGERYGLTVEAPSRGAVVAAESASVAVLLAPPLGHTGFSWRSPTVVGACGARSDGVPIGHSWASWHSGASLTRCPAAAASMPSLPSLPRDRTLKAVWALREAEAEPALQAARSAGASRVHAGGGARVPYCAADRTCWCACARLHPPPRRGESGSC